MPRKTRQARVPAPGGRSLAARRTRVGDLIGAIQPLTARSVLATALLGANEPRLAVSELIAAASLFAISPGAARTCLSRMVSSGELTSDDGSYALAGHLIERRHRIDDAARPDDASVGRWSGGWELSIVSLERRAAADRLELRNAAAALHLAEIREGVWTRPDNLDPQRLPQARAVLAKQCVRFRGAHADISVDTVRSLFALDAWSRDAQRLLNALDDELQNASSEHETRAVLPYQFALSIAVVRHLQRDPLLPAALLPDDWHATSLRGTYRRFDAVFKRRMNQAFRQGAR